MSQAQSTPTRRYELLFGAMNEILAVLAADGDEQQALEASFQAPADGVGAANALLLLVESAEPLRPRCLLSRGALTEERSEPPSADSPSRA